MSARDRASLAVFALIPLGLAAWTLTALDGVSPGARRAILAAWAASFLAGAAYQAVLWRQGRLVLRERAAQREERRRSRAAAAGVVPVGIGLGVWAGATGGVLALSGALGGLLLSMVPLLAYLAVRGPARG